MPPWSTLPQAPRRARTVGCPQAGAARGLPAVACPARAPLKRCPTDPPALAGVLPRALPGSPARHCPATPGAAKRPAPLCPCPGCPCTPCWHAPGQRAVPPLPRSSGLLRPSAPLRVPRSSPPHQVGAGCGQPLRGTGPARRALGAAVPACWAPSPGGACGARPRFFPHDSGLPPVRTGSALHPARAATAARRPLRGCSPSCLCRPAGVLTTPVAPPAAAYTAGQPWCLRPSRAWVVPSPRPG
jgi:hypothetical protein